MCIESTVSLSNGLPSFRLCAVDSPLLSDRNAVCLSGCQSDRLRQFLSVSLAVCLCVSLSLARTFVAWQGLAGRQVQMDLMLLSLGIKVFRFEFSLFPSTPSSRSCLSPSPSLCSPLRPISLSFCIPVKYRTPSCSRQHKHGLFSPDHTIRLSQDTIW